MKKNGILNSDISRVLSYMGHMDRIAIGDCGLPIPEETERIDLALTFGEPSFLHTLDILLQDMKVEKIILAEETLRENPKLAADAIAFFDTQKVEVEMVSHTKLKELTKDCKAVIRTGEASPYANIILQSACIFS